MSKKQTAVYIIRDDGRGVTKVGISDDPKRRLMTLQTGSATLLRLVYAVYHSQAQDIETLVHHALRSEKVHGEWFATSADVAHREILKAAAALGKPIVEGRRRSVRTWFFILFWIIVLAGFFMFLASLGWR